VSRAEEEAEGELGEELVLAGVEVRGEGGLLPGEEPTEEGEGVVALALEAGLAAGSADDSVAEGGGGGEVLGEGAAARGEAAVLEGVGVAGFGAGAGLVAAPWAQALRLGAGQAEGRPFDRLRANG
jgi:hypothetical protein